MKKILLSLMLTGWLTHGFGQFQRMLLPVGEYVINGLTAIPSYCIDVAEAAPGATDLYESFTSNVSITQHGPGGDITKPASEVVDKWVKISGTEGDHNSLQVAPVNPNDKMTYTLSVRGHNGFAGSSTSHFTHIPTTTLLQPYEAGLKQIHDPEIRKIVRQDIIWGVQDGTPQAELLREIAKARKSNLIDLARVNALPDAAIKKQIKEMVYNEMTDGESTAAINQRIQQALQIKELNWEALDRIKDESLKSRIKSSIQLDLLSEYEATTLKEAQAKVNNLSKISLENLESVANVNDKNLRVEAEENILFFMDGRLNTEELAIRLTTIGKNDGYLRTISRTLGKDPLLVNELKSEFHNDYSLLAEMCDRGDLALDASNQLTEKSNQQLALVREVKGKMELYRLHSYGSAYGDEIRKFQEGHRLTVTGYPDETFLKEVKEYGKPYDIIAEYNLSGKSEHLVAVQGDYYERAYLVDADHKMYAVLPNKPAVLVAPESMVELEADYFNKVKIASEDNEEVFVGIGSRVDEDHLVKLQVGAVGRDASWANLQSLSEVINVLKEEIGNLDAKKPIVLSRDLFQRGGVGSSGETGQLILNEHYVPGRTWVNFTELARALQKEFPNRRIYLGGNFSQDRVALSSMPTIRRASQIAAVGSPEDVTFRQIDVMRAKLQKAGIGVTSAGTDLATLPERLRQSNILLISGHKDQNFEKYLRDLAESDGLYGKVVAVFSCNEKGTMELNSYLLARGARKVIFFPDRVSIDAINAVLSELADMMPTLDSHTGLLFDDLLQKAIEKAAQKSPDLAPDINVLKDLLRQISIFPTLNRQTNA